MSYYRAPFNLAAHDFFLENGFKLTRLDAEWETVEDPRKLQGYPEADKYHKDDEVFYIDTFGRFFA